MKNYLYTVLCNIAFALLGFLSFVVLSRGLEPEVFGAWVFFLSISTLVDFLRFGFVRDVAMRMIMEGNHRESHLINGAGLRLSLKIQGAVSVVFLSLWVVGKNVFSDTISLVLLWYPLVGLSNVLWNNGLTWLFGRSKFRDVFVLKFVFAIVFILQLLLLFYYDVANIIHIIVAYVVANSITSLLSVIKGWDSVRYIIKAPSEYDKYILDQGKYSVISNLGSDVMRSIDMIIIWLSPVIGLTGIATYAISLKIVEVVEVAIRGVLVMGVRRITRIAQSGQMRKVKKIMARYAVLMMLMSLPIFIMVLFFPDAILGMFCGEHYDLYYHDMRIMLYASLIYCAMLVPDRLIGICMDVMGKSYVNTMKMMIIAMANIIGDLIAVFYFESVIGVVFVTLFCVVAGVVVGDSMSSPWIKPAHSDILRELGKIVKLGNRCFRLVIQKSRMG